MDAARWEQIFEARHGQAAREYYAPRPVPFGGVSAAGLTDASIYTSAAEG